jgi:enoyl-CoA hydratase/carnithine racemase
MHPLSHRARAKSLAVSFGQAISSNKQGVRGFRFFSNPQDSVSATSEKRVDCQIDGDGIARVSLNRPDKLNALDMPMFESLAQTAADLRSDRHIRAVILTGNGRAFCTGLDVKSMIRNGPSGTIERLLHRSDGSISNLAQDVAYQWRQLDVPVICVLHGMCFGGGLQIALGADFRFATADCQLSIMESKWGMIPDMSASITLRELVRMDVAKELTMTGRIISGLQAAELGLVTRCVEDPHHEAMKLAKEVIRRSPDSVGLSKQLYQQTWVAPEEYSLRMETELQLKLLKTWNQVAASGRNFGLKIPYFRRVVSSPTTTKTVDGSKITNT